LATGAASPTDAPSSLATALPETGALSDGVAYTPVAAEAALATLTLSPVPETAYDRADYPHWRSAKANGWEGAPSGCKARAAALLRDGTGTTATEKCAVTAGAWTDPYTGAAITDPKAADIDHLVPLAEAHRSGAWAWDRARRTAYANNPLVLVVSSATANRAKGDKGPDRWRPPEASAWCAYSVRWIEIKDEWDLGLTSAAERTALEDMLATCA
jgi:hypothetical protein